MEDNATIGLDVVNETADNRDTFVFENYSERITLAVFYCLVTVIGVVGNSLVILAFVLSRRLRSSTNWFVINLAFADLLTCLSLPFGVTALLSRDGWPLPEWVCSLAAALGFVCIGVSVTTLALIAYNRWFLLSQPRTKFKSFYCNRNISIMLGIAWLYSFLLVLAPHFAGLGRLGYSPRYKFCWHDTSVPTSDYYSLLAGPCLILPFSLFIIVVYVRIYVFVSKHNREMRESTTRSSSFDTTSSMVSKKERSKLWMISIKATTTENWASGRQNRNQRHPSYSGTEQNRYAVTVDSDSVTVSGVTETQTNPSFDTTDRRKSDKRARSRQYRHHVSVTKRLSIVVIAFFVCLLPFGISSVLPRSEPGIPWTGLMTTFNSCINPIIYAWTMPVFRRVMACVLFCRFRSIPNPARFIRSSR